MIHKAQHELATPAAKLGQVELDLATMQARRATIVKQLTGGIAQLFKGNGVDGIRGFGHLLKHGRAEVTDFDAPPRTGILEAKHAVRAAGSQPVELKAAPFDGDRIIDSWKARELNVVPKRLGVIGAGVIGLELGSVWKR